MDKQTLEFVNYCISKLAAVLGLAQSDVYRRLKVSGILDGYLLTTCSILSVRAI